MSASSSRFSGVGSVLIRFNIKAAALTVLPCARNALASSLIAPRASHRAQRTCRSRSPRPCSCGLRLRTSALRFSAAQPRDKNGGEGAERENTDKQKSTEIEFPNQDEEHKLSKHRKEKSEEHPPH